MPAHGPALLALSDDMLVTILAYLPFEQRLKLSLVCNRFRQLCHGPSQLWRTVEAAPKLKAASKEAVNEAAAAVVQGFRRWLAPKATAVEVLCFALRCPESLAVMEPFAVPGSLLPAGLAQGSTSLPLAKLSVEWPGPALLYFPGLGSQLKNLRKLTFPGRTHLLVHAPAAADPRSDFPSLTDFGLFDGTLGLVEGPPNTAAPDFPWLPPSLTALCLANAGLRQLPGLLAHLPRLRSLTVGENRLSGTASLDALSQLTQLEELNISECYLRTFPHQVSSLSNLRVLYLHNAFSRHADVAPADWDALRPLGRLVFLSISGNNLAQVPPGVAALSQLQALHIEENEVAEGLPVGPYLHGLLELLIDWQAALDSPAALRAATRLSRLVLTSHRAIDAAADGGLTVRPAHAAEPLLATLAAMPALRLVEDVFGEEDTVTAPVAHAMWQLGRRCPGVRLGILKDSNVGWSLADLPPPP